MTASARAERILVRTAALSRAFPRPGGETLLVLRDVTLTLAAGAALVVTGPSGSGKSTLLSILGTLDRPTGGRVEIDGSDPFALDEARLAAFRNRRIGFIFQEHHLLPQLTAIENVLLPTLAYSPAAEPRGADKVDYVARAAELLGRVGLADRQAHRPAELSGGERLRVATARALIRNPALLLADEPTGSLDRATADTVGELLAGLPGEHGMALVVVTHSERLAERFASRCELEDGVLVKKAG